MKITEKLGLKKPEPSDTFDIQDLNDNADILDRLWEIVYPVGAIYMSASNINPEELFGGTWVEWGSGRVPVGVSSSETEFATVEKTGGEKTHLLTTDEIPAHGNHTYQSNSAVGHGTFLGYLKNATMTTYSNARGWDLHSNDEITPAGFSVGGSGAHNNLQPYITCYMWKRTA